MNPVIQAVGRSSGSVASVVGSLSTTNLNVSSPVAAPDGVVPPEAAGTDAPGEPLAVVPPQAAATSIALNSRPKNRFCIKAPPKRSISHDAGSVWRGRLALIT